MEHIFSAFHTNIQVKSIEPFGAGLINDTYRVVNNDPLGQDFLLQRINHEVFKDAKGLMHNMELVTRHLSHKISTSSKLQGSCETLRISPTKNGSSYYEDIDGNFWRAVEFLKGYKSYDYVETPEQAYQGAQAFGQFMLLLNDFPVHELKETIPGFHDIIKRLVTFKEVVASTKKTDRVKECKKEIQFVLDQADQMCEIEKLRKSGKIKDRVTHNDTKFNNVLLKEDFSSHCVIDLDTVMPGIVHYDFGDGVRTCSSTAKEDEKDLNLVDVDMEKLKGFAQGFIETSKAVLDPLEIEYLALSAPLLAYIMGVRFLTDYLAGDVYYKIKHESHNLERARNQLRFTKTMTDRLSDISVIIKFV
ncbi:MAG: aminoglycoside phosphotransferase family protein [Reichenbachiella sp.]|uniref:phosphotransferase enzyme family protein n=1 Tax=Reichenbachiella sp. TaxID=2184521 RepID=UPI003299A01A